MATLERVKRDSLRASGPPRLRSAVVMTSLMLSISMVGCTALDKCGLSGCPGDAAITANVRGLFEQHPALEPPNLLRVQTVNGVVYLYGLVDTDLERQLAESIAHEASGVTTVVNSIGLSGIR